MVTHGQRLLFVRKGGFPIRPAERSRLLPTMQKINGRQWQGCGPGMPGPYGVAAVQAAREG